jgi:predicted transcriptional regulator
MSIPEISYGHRVITLSATDDNLLQIEAVCQALASDKRLAILRYLSNHTCSVMEIARALDLPQSTANQHISILEKAGLIKTDLQPATRGLQKMCARLYDQVFIRLPVDLELDESHVEVCMPVGAYVEADVSPTCGLAGEVGIIGHLDDPMAFFEPEHIYAQLLWFRHGFVEYRFANRQPPDAVPQTLEISFECCSEAPLHHLSWPSDITVWVNGVEIGTWTSPADFGGERGALTPSWWDNNNTQYGLLKIWKVTDSGSFVDGLRVSPVSLKDLKLRAGQFITIRIGVKDGAHNAGGINLFGRKFGNYSQDIVLRQRFQRGGKQNHS